MLIVLAAFAPAPHATRADTDLVIGGTATISDANGDDVRLRSRPRLGGSVLGEYPEGTTLAVLDGPSEASDGSFWYRVSIDGQDGYMIADYLASVGGGSEAITTSDLNLRSGPSTGDAVLLVMPPRAAVVVTGSASGGFYPVEYGGESGWAYGDYLDFDGTSGAEEPPAATSSIVWPVSGGEWEISQGYNGFSHYNGGGGYQYSYALDIYRPDGATAGQPVYAPAGGRVRWTERGSGGITIDLGDGYAVAMFHVTVDGGWQADDPIDQGDYIGFVSGPGGDGYVSDLAHLHMTVWETTDGGNWSRVAVPFTGAVAISGQDFPDTGVYSDWAGTLIYP